MKYILLTTLASMGLLISLYFPFLNSRGTAAAFRYLPSFCRIDGQTCERILSHPDARLFGVPNYVLGLLYYVLVLVLSFGHAHPLFVTAMRIASWITVALAAYLIYSLYYRVKVTCQMCLASHAVNLLLSILLTLW